MKIITHKKIAKKLYTILNLNTELLPVFNSRQKKNKKDALKFCRVHTLTDEIKNILDNEYYKEGLDKKAKSPYYGENPKNKTKIKIKTLKDKVLESARSM